ncbi:MAG: hypothetical protein A4E66_00795 [Syntrophus sp. PtaB.Bin001]|nr:MAG: hypothetical protein A4E66_00795 [Syntrophus sp. PtaB.Bin001]
MGVHVHQARHDDHAFEIENPGVFGFSVYRIGYGNNFSFFDEDVHPAVDIL